MRRPPPRSSHRPGTKSADPRDGSRRRARNCQSVLVASGRSPERCTDNTEDRIMAGDTVITIIGNLTSDPELRFTPSGAAVAVFTLALPPPTPRRHPHEGTGGWALF